MPEEGKDFLLHIATEEEFLTSCELIPKLSKEASGAKDDETYKLFMFALADHVSNIHSYLYNLTMEDCLHFNEWVLSWLTARRQLENSKRTSIVNRLEAMYKLNIDKE